MYTLERFVRLTLAAGCRPGSRRAIRTYATVQADGQAGPSSPDDRFVKIVEVGVRDGLQNIPGPPVSSDNKVELVHRLARAGVRTMEAGSFVRADRVPQMADTPRVLTTLARSRASNGTAGPTAEYCALVPNMRGLDNLLKLEEENGSGAAPSLVSEIALFVPASDGFCEANNGTTVDALLDSVPKVAAKAIQHGYKVRGYVSVVMTDPYDGPVAPEQVSRVAQALQDIGCHEISLGDTTGEGDPRRWETLWRMLSDRGIRMENVACHDTFGTAIPSIVALLPLGLRIVDASIAGLGGCPYSPGATGNVATEDVVYMLHKLGYRTGLDLDALVDTGVWISEQIGRANASRVGVAMAARRQRAEE